MTKKKAPRKPKPSRKEAPADRQRRAEKVLGALHKLYPQADCALEHKGPLELLVSTILSAQCTDDRVNKVTPALFAKYRRAVDFAKAAPAELEAMIRSTGFFRNKTKNIIGAARVMVEKFGGLVPDTMEKLLELPGVARKTANVVLGSWFKKNEGVVVDTHVGRLAHRLNLTWRSKDDKDAVRIEQDLMEILPQPEWTFTAHALIWHGRQMCMARNPACEQCKLAPHCPSAFTFGNSDKASGKRSRP